MQKSLFTIALLMGGAAIATPALSQSALTCAPRTVFTEAMTENRGEEMIGGGLHNGQQIVEIWASEETGSFTILMTFANGSSCLIGTGTHFNLQNAIPAAEGIPS